jgi:hypothetical protein
MSVNFFQAPRPDAGPRNFRSPSPQPPDEIAARRACRRRSIDRDGGAEARTDHADAVGFDIRILGEKGQRVARGLDLLEANEISARAFAFAAARHVDAQGDVAEILEHLAGLEHVGRTRVAAEAMHDDEGWALFTGLHTVRHPHRAGEFECTRLKRDFGLGHFSILPARAGSLRHLRGFDFRICQMRMQVSTNRGGWQMRGKSSVKAESGRFSAKAHSGWVLAAAGLTIIKS